jgi:hypothetical protein
MGCLEEIFKDILRANMEGMSREEAEYYASHDASPESGGVSGLTYYSETEPIAVDNYDDITQVVKDVYGPMDECPSLNDMVWIAWSAMLPNIKGEVIQEIKKEIRVPRSMVIAFSEMGDGLFMDAYTFVEEVIDANSVEIDSSIAGDIEELTREIQAYVFYKIDENEDMDSIEGACLEIESAYLDDDEYVILVAEE